MRNGNVWHDNDLVFCTEIGTLVDPSNFRREFKKLTRAAGLGDWAPYELRHSAASLLVAMGGTPLHQNGRGIGYTKSPFAQLFTRVA